jgi:peroxiredoxin
MTIKVGDKLPAGTLSEFIEVETAGCTVGPNTFKVEDLTRGKKVAIFGLPGAFTPTCSAKHVPSLPAEHRQVEGEGRGRGDLHGGQRRVRDGRLGARPEERGQGADDGRRQRRIHKALGLEFDLTAKGLGVRCQRFSMLVDEGVVKALNIEAPGKYEVSDADTLLKQMG